VAVGIAAAIGVLLLLQASFGSWRLAFLGFLALPLALAGGALGTLADGGTLSLGSLVGFFAVLGIAARSEILMITHLQHLEQQEGETFGPGLVLRAARERFTPIFVSALATGLALVPFVVLGELPGYELVHPLAVVVLGGLVTSTLLNLVVVPPLYLRVAAGSPANSVRRLRERLSAAHRVLPRT
jgi:Cu/Ag efflux pump CusA